MAEFRSIGARPDDTRGTTAAEVRKGIAGLLTGPGVLPGSSSPLVQGTASFAYQVNAGAWATPGGSGGGLHLWGNDGPLEVSTDPAPAAGLSRIDVIYAVHPSATENGDTTSEPVVAVAKGTPASSPVAPSLPPRAIELARNTMTSAATSTASAGNTIAQSAPLADVVSRAVTPRQVVRHRTTTNSIPDSVWTTLSSWNESVTAVGEPAEDFSHGGAAYTVTFTGAVRVRAQVGFATGAGTRYVRIMKNGVRVASGGTGTPSTVIPVTAEAPLVPVNPGDQFSVQVFQNTGAALSTFVDNQSTSFFIERLV